MEDLYQISFSKKRLNSIPGIADTVGAVIASTIGDTKRFSSARSAVGYLGYYPRQESSGLTFKKGLKMTKAGPNMAKAALYLAASTARLIDPELGKIYYEQMVVNGSCHTKAVCRVARALIPRLLRVMQEAGITPFVILKEIPSPKKREEK